MERIQKRIHQLELGEEIAAKDVKALLNAEQQQQLADALGAQVVLKNSKRARTGIPPNLAAPLKTPFQSCCIHQLSFISDCNQSMKVCTLAGSKRGEGYTA